MSRVDYLRLVLAIRRQLLRRGRVIVAIDGRCGSGKTTLAAKLQKQLHCSVFHMDDFFLRPEQRTEERFAAPGENVDHERFLEEVLLPLRSAQAVTFRPFSCARQQLGEPVLSVISLHPKAHKSGNRTESPEVAAYWRKAGGR